MEIGRKGDIKFKEAISLDKFEIFYFLLAFTYLPFYIFNIIYQKII